MYEQWLPPASSAPASQDAGKDKSRPWGLKLQAVEVDGGAIALRDEAPVRNADSARTVSLDLGSLRLRMGAIEPLAAKSRSEEHTSELQSQSNLVCRLLLVKKKEER